MSWRLLEYVEDCTSLVTNEEKLPGWMQSWMSPYAANIAGGGGEFFLPGALKPPGGARLSDMR